MIILRLGNSPYTPPQDGGWSETPILHRRFAKCELGRGFVSKSASWSFFENIRHMKLSFLNQRPDKVVINLKMLHSQMEDKISSKICAPKLSQ